MAKFTEVHKDYLTLFYDKWSNHYLTQDIRIFKNKETGEISPASLVANLKDPATAKVKVFSNETPYMNKTAAFELLVDILMG